MSFFRKYFEGTDDRVLMKWAHYYDIYERELAQSRDRPVSFLEIGVFKGGSVPMWKAFLADGSRLTFIDIDPACANHAEPGTTIEIGNQADPDFIEKIARTYGPFDIIVDDGSHVNAHQIKSFELLWPHIADGGVYVVEDCHTSYWPGFGGGYRNEASFIEFAKRLIDRMHSWYTDQDEMFPFDPIAKELESVRFFDSITMIEKRIKTGPPTLYIIENGRIEETTRPLKIRGRRSAFAGKDGS
ncbi:class I SAM-dependent methyltransferase [Lutimaribacter sp. EGI FJ00015]|uniref:Class I SAM-dependent methyltransferase n=1 Tax=Lutimaribacter degradans TaxID=2945989 RepID=A0ACC5ZZK0_9RHOB|nr:class I SAM-dependent methyltransferase [Lutimaribacter sp. EGI FJ00013]MCM2563771.1 class I SAM-dependent methyltransferase [Lutimaribacter sp. EGI FJ00013]MCO0614957.1 class I SAM-dependent methyltransferase [Lutimaribacter sp. EGI FJ00015]MCO0637651.1 class I SAM-dependent methyltransferase [Lutimaribacter sp. EGI FJ00014]